MREPQEEENGSKDEEETVPNPPYPHTEDNKEEYTTTILKD